MKKIIIVLIPFLLTSLFSTVPKAFNKPTVNSALIIIDVQDFYFPGGSLPLVGPKKAAENSAKIINYFRKNNLLVIHVRHKSKSGFGIYKLLTPKKNEKIFTKTEVNAFKGTELKQYLDEHGIKNLVICGMQTQMCVEGAARAASDYGFKIILIGDACATRDLDYKGVITSAAQVHASTLKTLDRVYAKVLSTDEFLKSFNKKKSK